MVVKPIVSQHLLSIEYRRWIASPPVKMPVFVHVNIFFLATPF